MVRNFAQPLPTSETIGHRPRGRLLCALVQGACGLSQQTQEKAQWEPCFASTTNPFPDVITSSSIWLCILQFHAPLELPITFYSSCPQLWEPLLHATVRKWWPNQKFKSEAATLWSKDGLLYLRTCLRVFLTPCLFSQSSIKNEEIHSQVHLRVPSLLSVFLAFAWPFPNYLRFSSQLLSRDNATTSDSKCQECAQDSGQAWF